jgi:hypothetical protein
LTVGVQRIEVEPGAESVGVVERRVERNAGDRSQASPADTAIFRHSQGNEKVGHRRCDPASGQRGKKGWVGFV